MFENWGQIDWKFIFGRSGLNSWVFEKLFILYSCILFIKYYALGSFCIKMLYFSKNLIFPDFRSIELVARSIKIAIKNLVWICLARLVLDQSNVIFDRSNLFFDQSKIGLKVFFKSFFSHVPFTTSKFSKAFLTLFDRSRFKASFFVVFPHFFPRVFVF